MAILGLRIVNICMESRSIPWECYKSGFGLSEQFWTN